MADTKLKLLRVLEILQETDRNPYSDKTRFRGKSTVNTIKNIRPVLSCR